MCTTATTRPIWLDDEAEHWACLGWRVGPLRPGTKVHVSAGTYDDDEVAPSWPEEFTSDPVKARRLMHRQRFAGLAGIPPWNVLVLDVDTVDKKGRPKPGLQQLQALEDLLGESLLRAHRTHETGSGAYQILMTYPGGRLSLRGIARALGLSSLSKLAFDLRAGDHKGAAGYIVLPPTQLTIPGRTRPYRLAPGSVEDVLPASNHLLELLTEEVEEEDAGECFQMGPDPRTRGEGVQGGKGVLPTQARANWSSSTGDLSASALKGIISCLASEMDEEETSRALWSRNWPVKAHYVKAAGRGGDLLKAIRQDVAHIAAGLANGRLKHRDGKSVGQQLAEVSDALSASAAAGEWKRRAAAERVLIWAVSVGAQRSSLNIELSQRTAAIALGVKRETAARAIKHLVEMGWLMPIKRLRGCAGRCYRLRVPMAHRGAQSAPAVRVVAAEGSWVSLFQRGTGMPPSALRVLEWLLSNPAGGSRADTARGIGSSRGTITKALAALDGLGVVAEASGVLSMAVDRPTLESICAQALSGCSHEEVVAARVEQMRDEQTDERDRRLVWQLGGEEAIEAALAAYDANFEPEMGHEPLLIAVLPHAEHQCGSCSAGGRRVGPGGA